MPLGYYRFLLPLSKLVFLHNSMARLLFFLLILISCVSGSLVTINLDGICLSIFTLNILGSSSGLSNLEVEWEIGRDGTSSWCADFQVIC